MLKDVVGIVLKERDYGESSKILDVLTKEYGLIGVISKGSKKMKSNLSGVSTRLTYGVFHIYYKEDKLSTLTGVDVLNPFINIKKNIINISFATFLSGESVIILDLPPHLPHLSSIGSTPKYESSFNSNMLVITSGSNNSFILSNELMNKSNTSSYFIVCLTI